MEDRGKTAVWHHRTDSWWILQVLVGSPKSLNSISGVQVGLKTSPTKTNFQPISATPPIPAHLCLTNGTRYIGPTSFLETLFRRVARWSSSTPGDRNLGVDDPQTTSQRIGWLAHTSCHEHKQRWSLGKGKLPLKTLRGVDILGKFNLPSLRDEAIHDLFQRLHDFQCLKKRV